MPRQDRLIRSLAFLPIVAPGTYGSYRPLARFLLTLVDGIIEYVLACEVHTATPATRQAKNLTIPPAQSYTRDPRTPRRLVLSNPSNRSCNSLDNSSCSSFAITPIGGQTVLHKL